MQRNFNDIYEKIHKNSKEELDKLKKNNLKNTFSILFVIIICLTLFYIGNLDVSIILLIAIIAIVSFLLFFSKSQADYRNLYKEKVISILVKEYDSNFRFHPYSTMSAHDYRRAEFDNLFDKFRTEDEITGSLADGSKIKMAQIATFEEREVRDSEGHIHKEETETFRGLYGIVVLTNPILNNINISSNSFLRKYDTARIEVDSAEFEKRYDLYALDKLNAMEIFTSELIEMFINLKKNYAFELKVFGNCIYFRYRCGEMFEPPALKSGVTFDLLFKYFSIIDFPVGIIEKIIDNNKSIGKI